MEEYKVQDSVFTKIIKGEIPAHKVYEDDNIIAFMDINPVHEGHTLVVPKQQVDHFGDLDDAIYDKLWRIVKKVAKAQKKAFDTNRIGIQVVGLDVPHAHVHVIPFNTIEEYRFVPLPGSEPDHIKLEQNAKLIKENM